MAKFKNEFLISSIIEFFANFTNSKACNPAIEAVVVAKAGIIFPAFIFTFNQSISTSDDPSWDGRDADLYIGYSANQYYGTYNNLTSSLEKE